MIDLYIYYQVSADKAAMLLEQVSAMQALLASGHALKPQLKRRPEADQTSGLQTWMEVYPDAADDFAAVVENAVRANGLALNTAGPRHSEVFVALTAVELIPCA